MHVYVGCGACANLWCACVFGCVWCARMCGVCVCACVSVCVRVYIRAGAGWVLVVTHLPGRASFPALFCRRRRRRRLPLPPRLLLVTAVPVGPLGSCCWCRPRASGVVSAGAPAPPCTTTALPPLVVLPLLLVLLVLLVVTARSLPPPIRHPPAPSSAFTRWGLCPGARAGVG